MLGRGRQETAPAALDWMVGAMTREPFDVAGTWSHDRLGVSVGWVCHRAAFADCLPVWSETKDVCLIFTGEHFADRSEIANLRTSGHQFDEQNASTLVHLYEESGPAFIEALNGWFAGVLVDLRTDTIILFNDRYGLNRVYIHENADAVFFASEAKSLLRILPDLRRLDPVSLAEFVSCGCALQGRTLFQGVSLLPPASRWTFRPGQPAQKHVYFRSETWESHPPLSDAEFYERLGETVPRVLTRYFAGPQKIGISLTGGLDSRLIMAWSRRPAGTSPCYSFGGSYRDCFDVTIARQVARSCGQPHQTLLVGSEFLENFPTLAEKAVQISDGAMDVTGSVELYVNEIARRIAPVRLTGNYGSEILRRNVAFKARPLDSEVYSPDFVGLGARAVSTYGREAECHPLSFIAFKQVPWHHHSRLSVERSRLTVRSPYLDNELVRLAYQASSAAAVGPGPYLRLIADGSPALSRIPTDRGLLYAPRPLVTRATHLYQEFTFRLEYAFDYGMPRWLASINRAVLPSAVERSVLGRHKFYHFRVWYRDAVGRWLKDVLLDPRAQRRGHVRAGCLEDLVIGHTTGRGNHTTELHKLLSIELMYRQLIEST